MGRLRVSLAKIMGVKFDKNLARQRFIGLGVTNPETLETIVSTVEQELTRKAFLEKIREKKNNGRL